MFTLRDYSSLNVRKTLISMHLGIGCNAQHYFDYLLQSRVNNAAGNCPVFRTFTDAESVQRKDFQLASEKSLYNWPATSWFSNSKRALTIVENPRWKPQSTYVSGSMRSSMGYVSRTGSRGSGRRGPRNATTASRTQGKIDTASRYRGGGGGTGSGAGWGNGGKPIGTGGTTSGAYPNAGAYPYNHPQDSRQKSTASRVAPPFFSATGSAVRAGLRMIGA